MLVLGLIAAALAAALHIVIFYMESIAWEGALARKTFGGTAAEARPHAFYAFNQGFYNLFLAIETIAGIAIAAAGNRGIGAALALAGTGSMLAAALVLLLSSRPHRAAALKQGSLPLLAVVALAIGLLA
ncbi:DUF1304 domain-containing protein [Actinomyces gaoshouyii]|uniref:Membrane protein n=1 Tax=Actinomyces gaoshouyii TaxID=1960083 RepID=A0A8H9LL97_9ACTO|nr:DUF1304 domain-containing protein [Actinomyces gaoshouyii]ARD41971.1 hypothetical protein B6G06_06140 [Actinomyces gaoshouyii]GGO97050.1 membrane protein [Actinomyces gaoshouyii]